MDTKDPQNTTELWKVTQKWLVRNGAKPNPDFCKEELTTHPDYPALTSVVDFLDAGNMNYQVVKTDKTDRSLFNYPVMAHISYPGMDFMYIISGEEQWDNEERFLKYWSGVAIFPAKGAKWKNAQNDNYNKTALKNKLTAVFLIMASMMLFIYSANFQNGAWAIVWGVFTMLGLFTSIVLMGTELGYQSQVVKQFCGAVSAGGCEKVLKSKYSKGVLGITPATASLFYFSLQFIIFLLNPWFPFLFPVLRILAYPGFVVAIWSIYTQSVKIKQWCALCLCIAVTLFTQTVLAAITPVGQIRPSGFLYFILIYGGISLLLGSVLFPLMGLIRANKVNKQKAAELRKWKNDIDLFKKQLEGQQQATGQEWDNDLLLGNPDAPVLITIACNPYCAPCARSHGEIEKLLVQFNNKLKVRLRFAFNANNKDDRRTKAVEIILKKARALNDHQKVQELVADWFRMMDIEKWSNSWQIQADGMDVQEIMHQHAQWIRKNRITATPTIFINDRKMPGKYNLEDLPSLIMQMSDGSTENKY